VNISIIILSYNTKDLLKQTLDSLCHKNFSDREYFVVDNASTDGSPQMVKKDYPWVTLIANHDNKGFAAANNQAIKIAKGKYLVLLNSDTEVIDDALGDIARYLDNHPDVGAITPKIMLTNGQLDPACHRGMPTPWRSFCYFAGLEKLFPTSRLFGGYHQAYLDLNTTHVIETSAATGFMVRKQMVDEIGMLDEAFFLYGEDLDWCMRMNQANWKIVYFADATIIHYKSQSGKKNKKSKTKSAATHHFYNTMYQFYEKHYSKTYPTWVRQLVYAGIRFKQWLS
jgi:GT2 family glycosyltransferase